MRDLRRGVNAGVGASSASDVDVAEHLRGRAQEVALDGFRRVTLRLPARVPRSFVLDRELVSRHASRVVPGGRRSARSRLGRRPRIILSARSTPPRLPLRGLLRRAGPLRPHVGRTAAALHARRRSSCRASFRSATTRSSRTGWTVTPTGCGLMRVCAPFVRADRAERSNTEVSSGSVISEEIATSDRRDVVR